MTRDEILAMPVGRELDALVAEKVMGLTIPNRHNARFYSTDISAAWEVVERMRSMGLHLRLNIGINSTQATFVTENSGKWEYVTSNSTALAICQAALLTTIGADKP